MRIEGVRLVLLGRYGNQDYRVADDSKATANMTEYHRKWRERNLAKRREQQRNWYRAKHGVSK